MQQNNTRGAETLRMLATARYAPGGEHGGGEVVGYCDAPMVCIRRPDGSTFWWRADQCTFEQPPPNNGAER